MISVNVGMAELKTVKNPGTLTAIGLGSCVGVVIYDPLIKCAGMVHIMLPYKPQNNNVTNPAKFADTGISLLVNELSKMGAVSKRMISKIAGGAQMFNFKSATDIMKIGERNVEAAQKVLSELNIPVISKSTGGNYGRTIEFYTGNCILYVKTIGSKTIEI
jgi:chemotaxis protein CheD